MHCLQISLFTLELSQKRSIIHLDLQTLDAPNAPFKHSLHLSHQLTPAFLLSCSVVIMSDPMPVDQNTDLDTFDLDVASSIPVCVTEWVVLGIYI